MFSCRHCNFVLKLSEPSLFLLITGQNNHPARSVKIASQSVKSQAFFCSGGWQPCNCVFVCKTLVVVFYVVLDLNLFGCKNGCVLT